MRQSGDSNVSYNTVKISLEKSKVTAMILNIKFILVDLLSITIYFRT